MLFEHLSNPDKMIAFRLFKYMICIMEHHLHKNKGNKNNCKLPIIYPIILYTGHKKYTSATSVFDLFEENKDLAKDIFLNPHHFINVHEIPDEKLNFKFLQNLSFKSLDLFFSIIPNAISKFLTANLSVIFAFCYLKNSVISCQGIAVT